MVYMMDNMWGYGFPFWWSMSLVIWLVFFVIGYFVYKDANSRGMNGLLWFILIIIPMIGILGLILYLVIRDSGSQKIGESKQSAIDILKERYAKGEITTEQFHVMSEELKK